MLNFSRGTVLLCLSGVLAVSNLACRGIRDPQPETVSAASVAKPSPVAAKSPAKPTQLHNHAYQSALDKAQSAKSMSQSVQTAEDWDLVASRWRQAIALLKQVPKSDPKQKLVKQKLAEYQQSLALAQRRSAQTGNDRGATLESGIRIDTPITENVAASTLNGTHRARIKYRQSRIPVIDVVFNGNRQFEMLVDTGASGTMITPDMAEALQARILGTTTAITPAGPTQVTIGLIKSIQVGRHVIRDVPVAIGPVRLLGHDFFERCDISIKRDVVEFQQCSG